METLIACKLHFEVFFSIITCQKYNLPVYSFICRPSRNNRMKLQSFFSKRQYIQSNDPRKKMIGGQAADPREHPWQALVVLTTYNTTTHKFRFFNKCGGTLISDQWVLTSHRCMDNSNPIWRNGSMQVVLGGYVFPPNYQTGNEVTEVFGLEKVVGVKKIVRHPYGGLLAYDIALLKMDSRVNLTPRIFPACFPGYEIQVVEFSNRGYKIRKICD